MHAAQKKERKSRSPARLERRQETLSQVEAREDKSLARDQRRIKGAAYDEPVNRRERAEEFREAAADRSREQGPGAEPEKPEEQKQGPKQKRPRGFGYRPS